MGNEQQTPAEDTKPDSGAGPGIDVTDDAGDLPAGQADDLGKLLEDARAKADDHWNEVLRSKAELDNIRKRAARDVENAHKFGLERFMSELLPVRDSMELGLQAASEDGTDLARVREGIELTLKMFNTALEKFGAVEIDPTGQKFDPEKHQAMTMEASPTVASGHVVSVVQKGLALNERLIRPAMVIVAK